MNIREATDLLKLDGEGAKPSATEWHKQVPLETTGIVKKGMIWVFGFLGLFLLWAFVFPIASAVVVQGKIISAGQNKKIQHPSGGVIHKIMVADGDRVEQGQVLVVLDSSGGQAELTRLQSRRAMLAAQKTRLEAEASGKEFDALASTGLRLGASDDKNGAVTDGQVLRQQRNEFDAGRKRLQAELDAAQFQIESLKDQMSGLETRLAGADQLKRYTQMEIKKVKPLVQDGYLAKNRLWDLEKRYLEQVTQVGNLEAEIDSTNQRVREAEARLAQLSEADRENRSEELTRVISELAEISDQLGAAKTVVQLTELRAPEAGTVVNLAVHTNGGVLQSGETLAEIVPDGSGLETEFRVEPADIDTINVGQAARVVITAFNRRTYEPIEGEITYVSADSVVDQQTGMPYFTARAKLRRDPQKQTGFEKLQAGMAAEVYALAEPRVFMSYALQPIFDSFGKAFREAR